MVAAINFHMPLRLTSARIPVSEATVAAIELLTDAPMYKQGWITSAATNDRDALPQSMVPLLAGERIWNEQKNTLRVAVGLLWELLKFGELDADEAMYVFERLQPKLSPKSLAYIEDMVGWAAGWNDTADKAKYREQVMAHTSCGRIERAWLDTHADLRAGIPALVEVLGPLPPLDESALVCQRLTERAPEVKKPPVSPLSIEGLIETTGEIKTVKVDDIATVQATGKASGARYWAGMFRDLSSRPGENPKVDIADLTAYKAYLALMLAAYLKHDLGLWVLTEAKLAALARRVDADYEALKDEKFVTDPRHLHREALSIGETAYLKGLANDSIKEQGGIIYDALVKPRETYEGRQG